MLRKQTGENKMKKTRSLLSHLRMGLGKTGKAFGLMAKKNVYYKETPQVKGRVARAFAKETVGGKGKVANRPSYKKHMATSYKDKTRQERGKMVYALAKATKGGQGKIVKRPAHRTHVPMR